MTAGSNPVLTTTTVYYYMKELDLEEKQFSGNDMIEFCNWYSEGDVNKECLETFMDDKKQKEEREYQAYLKLKEKYEPKGN